MADPTELDTKPSFKRGRMSRNQPLDKSVPDTFLTAHLPNRRVKSQSKFAMDGDTVRMADGSNVRLVGIDTPETGKDGEPSFPFADEAKARLQELLGDGNLTMEFDDAESDNYNRQLATLLTGDGKNIQEILLTEGLAKEMSIEPNTRLQAFYKKLEAQAKKDKVGMWADPVPKKDIGDVEQTELPEGYVPAYKRSNFNSKRDSPISPTGVLDDTLANITEDGLTRQGINFLSDLSELEKTDTDEKEIAATIDSVIAQRKLSPQAKVLILDKAQNANHAVVLADRILAVQNRQAGRDAMSLPAMAASGIMGFIADPVNLVPGTLIFRGATATAKALPKLRPAITRMMPTLSGKAGTYAAFAATEEALRTIPRLQADPTYEYDNYLTNIALAGTFGAGIARAVPTGKFVFNKALAPAFKSVNASLSKGWAGVKESVSIRTSVNMMTDAVKFGKKNKAPIKETLDEVNNKGFVQRARDKARQQVADSQDINKINKARTSIFSKLNKADADLASPELTNDIADELSNIVNVIQGKSKAKDKFDFKSFADDAKAAATDTEVPRKFQDVLTDVEKLRTRALQAIEKKKGAAADEARTSINAVALQAIRSVEAAAARQGVKLLRKTTRAHIAQKAAGNRIKSSLDEKRTGNFDKLVADATAPDAPQFAVSFDKTLKSVMRHLNIKQKPGKANLENLTKYIFSRKNGITTRATKTREQVTTQFNRAREELETHFAGTKMKDEFLEARRMLDEQQDELESLFDSIGLINEAKFSDLVELDPRWAKVSAEFENSIPKKEMEAINKAYESTLQKTASKQFGRLTQSLGTRLFRTGVPLARMQAMNIFEMPTGLGGNATRHNTASILARMHTAKFTHQSNVAWRDMMEEAATDMGLGTLSKAKMQNFNPNTPGVQQDIARQVMKAVSRAQQGKTSNTKPYIDKFVKALDKINSEMYDLQLKHNVSGITGQNKMKNYLRQHWNDGAILDLINDQAIGHSGVRQLMAKSLMSRAAGKLEQADAQILAKTIIDLKLEAMNKPRIDTFTLRTENLMGSMSAIEDILKRMSGKQDAAAVQRILAWVNEPTGGVAGYVQKRNINLDYETTITKNGKTVSILDLLDNDVIGQVNRYAREAGGRSALSEATHGRLNSEQAIDDLINATQQQANSMGTLVNTKDLRNAYRELMGIPYDGQLPIDVRKARDMVALTFMGGLGESQLAEFGLSVARGFSGLFAMNQVGSKSLGRAKQWAGIKLTPEQQANTKFLNELQEYSRFYEDMHIFARQNVHFDARESNATTGLLSKIVETGTGGKYRPMLQYLQTRYTGYGAVRTLEEQTAMAALVQDAMKTARGKSAFTSPERLRDLGLDVDIFKKYLKDGTITLRKDGNVEALNMHSWSQADQTRIGVALNRHVGQQVQFGFSGESSPEMLNPAVAMLLQFRSYPMLAAEKQMGRSIMFHDKEAGMTIAANTASSAAARIIRYYSLAAALPSEKREAYLEKKFSDDLLHDTAAYMGIVGMLVNNTDLAQDFVFGSDKSLGSALPAINWADNYINAAKAANPLDEDGLTERDVSTMQQGSPLGTIMWLNGFFGIIRNLMTTDKDDRYQEADNRNN